MVEGLPQYFLDAGLTAQLSLDTYARDDEDIALLKWSALPDPGLRVSIHSVLHIATISASDQLNGMTRVVFVATAAQGATGSDTLVVNVHGNSRGTTQNGTTGSNLKPTISGIPALSFYRDQIQTLTLDRYVEDDGPLSALNWMATPSPNSRSTLRSLPP